MNIKRQDEKLAQADAALDNGADNTADNMTENTAEDVDRALQEELRQKIDRGIDEIIKKGLKRETNTELSEEFVKEIYDEEDEEWDEEMNEGWEEAFSDVPEKGEKRVLSRKRRKGSVGRWIILALFVLIFAAGAGVYYKGAMHYQTHFFPNTVINGIACGEMDAEEVAALLNGRIDGYRLTVTGRDYSTGESGALLGEIAPKEIDLVYADMQNETERLMAEQSQWKWVSAYFGKKDFSYELNQGITYNSDKLKKLVLAWDAFQPENMRKTQDAYISDYSSSLNGYEVVPEMIGTEFTVDEALRKIEEALAAQKESFDMEAQGSYEDVAVKQEDKVLQDAVSAANTWLSAKIAYDWNGNNVRLDKELLTGWVSIVNNEAVLDEKQIESFVKKQASQYDTYGKDRTFKTTHGVVLTLPSGYYGWKTDIDAETQELTNLIRQGSNVDREPIYSSVARQKGMSDIGDSYVEADMTHQHLYLYNKGQLVLETDFVSGNMSNDSATPQGVFGIAYKTTNVVLRGRDYESPVSYWMPYYGNYGMHDATWRDEFGGDIYLTDGSHGCLNLPLEKAGEIYQYMSKGFPVVCYFYDVDPLAGQLPAAGGEIVYEFNPHPDDDEDEE